MSLKRLASALSCCSLILATTGLQAQEAGAGPPPGAESDSLLRVGARVRLVESTGRTSLTGRVLRLGDRSMLLEVREGAAPVEVWRADSRSLQVSTGRQRRTKRGALIGGATLAVPGIALGALLGAGPECYEHCGAEGAFRGGAALGLYWGTFGAGLGALIGHMVVGDDWQPVTPRRFSAQLVPTRRGLGASVSFRF